MLKGCVNTDSHDLKEKRLYLALGLRRFGPWSVELRQKLHGPRKYGRTKLFSSWSLGSNAKEAKVAC